MVKWGRQNFLSGVRPQPLHELVRLHLDVQLRDANLLNRVQDRPDQVHHSRQHFDPVFRGWGGEVNGFMSASSDQRHQDAPPDEDLFGKRNLLEAP